MRRRHQQLDFAGSIHFVTTTTRVRGMWFVEPNLCTRILEMLEWYRAKHDLQCLGYVLMPDHLHVLLHQSEAGAFVSRLMAGFKRETSKQARPHGYPTANLWKDRFDDVPVPGNDAVVTKLVYVHGNPVRRGLVQEPLDYPWSSARDYFADSPGIVRITKA
ncbi:MAG: transposase [bacterium]|nr:transposase [bacterium]